MSLNLEIQAAAAADRLRAAVADVLDFLARETGDPRYTSARALVMGDTPGRRKIDDTAALEHARSLLESGLAKSKHEACRRAARFVPGHSTEATARRLRRKFSDTTE